MPIFCYKCPECGWTDEQWKQRADRNVMPMCQKCGNHCERDLGAEMGRRRNATCGEVVSINAGVQPWQVAQANQELAAAGLGDCFHDREGDLHCPDRNRYLKALHYKGYANRDEIRGHHNR